jgi:hypothetical protein
VNTLIKMLAKAAPAKACFAGTPKTIIGGAIIKVLAAVQAASLIPDPVLRSRKAAADL